MKKNEIFNDLSSVREKIKAVPLNLRPVFLAFFVNEVGIVRQQLPTIKNEEALLTELKEKLSDVITDDEIEATKKRLAQDRGERMEKNMAEIIPAMQEKEKSIWDYIPFGNKMR